MTIRKLTSAEIESSIRMSEFAFQFELTDEERREEVKLTNADETWVIEENGEILSKATVLPLHIYMQGQKLAMGGVSGVVTWPEHRRSGLVAKLLKQSLEQMKEDGQLVSFLYPFSIPFYRKFGWELFADMETLTLTRDQLPRREQYDGTVKRVEKNASEVNSVYQQWAKQYAGTIVRDEKWWTQSVFKRKKGTLVAYYNQQGTSSGYLIYEVKNKKMTVHELIWLDADARRGLWHFISNHDSMIDSVTIHTATHDRLPFLLTDPKVKREVSSYFMARIIDVKEFLAIYPFSLQEGEAPIILHVFDEFCQWNDGIYMIKKQDGEIDIKFFPSSENVQQDNQGSACQHPPKKGIRLSVHCLTASLFNTQPVDVLYDEEWIKGDIQTLEAFRASIPKLKPFLYDFF
ncbi:enhanced intracellular survival protein Eis [Salipaludibacillus sp. HK11]|uniref:GNAT family N-acetyltransferase n=1 Tax=Salipaludibacillus sp. HK11 TaxID=3394320 RepID=UPI0039FD25E8